MGCGTQIVPNFNEYNKMYTKDNKNPALEMKMNQLLSANNPVTSSPKKTGQDDLSGSVSETGLSDKELENYNKLTKQNSESFENNNRFIGKDSLTDKEIQGLYNRTLAQSMTDEGIKLASEKGIPRSVMYTEGAEYAGRWEVGKDQIAIDLEPFTASGGVVKDHLHRVILHEHGHFIMNRLLRMRMVNDKDVRYTWNKEGTSGTGNALADITDFTPQFTQAFLSDMMKLGLNRNDDHKLLLDIAIQHDLEVTYGGSDGLRGSPSYDGRLEGYYDILDAMTLGELHTNYNVGSGHGTYYYEHNAAVDGRFGRNRPYHEAAANLFEAKYNKDQFAWNRIKKDMPSLAKAFDKLMAEYDGQTKMFINEDFQGNDIIVENTHARDE